MRRLQIVRSGSDGDWLRMRRAFRAGEPHPERPEFRAHSLTGWRTWRDGGASNKQWRDGVTFVTEYRAD